MQKFSINDEGLAIGAYDPVAYFSGSAVPGRSEFTLDWGGASWRFSSATNAKRFETDPQRYAPQFGGFCAFGMGFGKAAPADPNAFVVDNGKLYLSASPMVRRFWKWFGNHARSARQWRKLQ